MPYIEASKLSIPTKEQYYELFSECHHSLSYKQSRDVNGLIFTGKTGKSILIEYAEIEGYDKPRGLYFWLKDEKESNLKLSARTSLKDRKLISSFDNIFMGLKLPIILVD